MQMKVTVVEGAVELIDVVNGLEVAVELEGVVMVRNICIRYMCKLLPFLYMYAYPRLYMYIEINANSNYNLKG